MTSITSLVVIYFYLYVVILRAIQCWPNIRLTIPFSVSILISSYVSLENSETSLLCCLRLASSERARLKAMRYIFAMLVLRNLKIFCGFSIIRELGCRFFSFFKLIVNISCTRRYSIYSATVQEWTSILKIACGHETPDIKHLAVGWSLAICPSHVALNYTKHMMSSRVTLFPSMSNSVREREDAPTDEETGVKATLAIHKAREAAKGSHVTPPNSGNTISILGYHNHVPQLNGLGWVISFLIV